MYHLDNSKIGDVVITGDSNGVNISVCIKARNNDSNVTFLSLLDGACQSFKKNEGFDLSTCQKFDRISPEQVEIIKKAWNYNENIMIDEKYAALIESSYHKFSSKEEMEKWVHIKESSVFNKEIYQIIKYIPMVVKSTIEVKVDVS